MPYLRVTRSQFDPAVADELRRVSPDFVAAIQHLPGLQHQHGGFDRESGRAIAVLVFDTREHAEFDAQALGPITARLQALGMRIESREIYEATPE